MGSFMNLHKINFYFNFNLILHQIKFLNLKENFYKILERMNPSREQYIYYLIRI